MKTLLALLLPALCIAQTITELPVQKIYPGNPGVIPVLIAPYDTAQVLTATLYYSREGRPLATALQPVVSKPTPTTGRIYWPITSNLPPLSYVRVKVGDYIKYGAVVDVSPYNVNITPPGSLTLIYPPGSGSGPPAPAPDTALSIWQQLTALLFY